MPRWGMVIDTFTCVGCYACQISCKQAHFLPPNIFWNRLCITETGKYQAIRKHTYPILCNHCKEAPCVNVCPTGASYKREDGIVVIDYDKCVGCKYCVIACPYQQRTPYEFKQQYPGQSLTEYETFGKELSSFQYEEGTAVKCIFCMDRVDDGIAKGLTPGVDWEATPVCVNACPTKSRHFGDLDNPQSKVSGLIREKKGQQLHPEFETDPSVYYLTY